MPDLHRASALRWLSEAAPGLERRCGGAVRSLEDAALVHPPLVEFGKALDSAAGARPARLVTALSHESAGELRELLAQLGPARLLRLLSWFEAELPGGERLGESLFADRRSEAGLTLHTTLRELRRLALLDCIFSPERLAVLLEVMSIQRKEAV